MKAPHVDDIRWQVTPESLMAIAEKQWPAVERAVKELVAEYENTTLNLSDEERRRKPTPRVKPKDDDRKHWRKRGKY